MTTYKDHIKCLHPISITNPRYRSKDWERTGDGAPWSRPDYKIIVPCGHCILCRKRKSTDWHFRLFHEFLGTPFIDKKQTRRNVLFCTFTFNNDHLPDDSQNGLRSRIAPFIRQWRDVWRKRYGTSPRYWITTDIGNEGRLHLHAVIFNPTYKDGRRIPKSKLFMTTERWIKDHPGKPVPSDLQCCWRYGFCTYCSYLEGEAGIHYVAGYLNGSNVLKQVEAGKVPKKHRKALCRKALHHIPAVFVSSGLGKSFLVTQEFEKLKLLKSFICRLGKYKYAVPRYFRSKYFEDTIEMFVDEATGELHEMLVPAEQCARNFIAALCYQMRSDYEAASLDEVSICGKSFRLPRNHVCDYARDESPPPWSSLVASYDKVYGFVAPPPRPVDTLCDVNPVIFVNIHSRGFECPKQLSIF